MMTLTRSFQVPTYMVLGLATAYGRIAPAAGRWGAAARVDGKLLGRLNLVAGVFVLAALAWVRASVHWR
jgi:hypothetical protein